MKTPVRPQRRSRGAPVPWGLWLVVAGALFALMPVGARLLSLAEAYPLEAAILVTIFTLVAISGVLYVSELVVIGWIMDLLDWLTISRIRATDIALEYAQLGDIIVVQLTDNIVTAWQCQLVHKELKRLIDAQHCDVILDFSGVQKVTIRFREAMLRLTKIARREAERQGKPHRPIAVPPGEIFRVFDDRESAVAEMAQHDGHGWLVLCGVPAGIRAVSETIF